MPKPAVPARQCQVAYALSAACQYINMGSAMYIAACKCTFRSNGTCVGQLVNLEVCIHLPEWAVTSTAVTSPQVQQGHFVYLLVLSPCKPLSKGLLISVTVTGFISTILCQG
jgi:hypothetical protein